VDRHPVDGAHRDLFARFRRFDDPAVADVERDMVDAVVGEDQVALVLLDPVGQRGELDR